MEAKNNKARKIRQKNDFLLSVQNAEKKRQELMRGLDSVKDFGLIATLKEVKKHLIMIQDLLTD